jgi:ABC-type lipoprotein release transport system permease subunit
MYKLKLAFRYLYRRRISYLALAAVTLCVFIVVVVMTVMDGLVGDFKRKNHDFTGDCVVGTQSLTGFPYYDDFTKILESSDFVDAASGVIRSYAFVGAEGSTRGMGTEMLGIDPVSYSRATGFGESLHYHKSEPAKAFEVKGESNLSGCVTGVDMLFERDSHGDYDYGREFPKIALSVTCFPLTAKGALAKAGTDVVNTKTFYVSDSSQSGLARVDGSIIYLPFDEAQTLCGMDGTAKRASRIHIKFKQGTNIDEGTQKVRAMWAKFRDEKGKENADLLRQVIVQDWKENRRETIAGMEKEQVTLMMMFSMVGLTTVFIVYVVFYMIISHKTKDIGILKSIGASFGDVIGLFMGFAAALGIIGSAVGVCGAVIFLRNINRIEGWLFERFGFQMWDRTIYAIGEIPHRLDMTLILVITGCAVLACLAGAMLPSVGAARARPADVLQVSQL